MDAAIKRSVEIFLQCHFRLFCRETVTLKPVKAKQKEAWFASQTHFDVFQLAPTSPLLARASKTLAKPEIYSRFIHLTGISNILDSQTAGGSRTNTVQLSHSDFLFLVLVSKTKFNTCTRSHVKYKYLNLPACMTSFQRSGDFFTSPAAALELFTVNSILEFSQEI